ncbi:DUF2799 domain-containing protein [Bacteriovoracales bacterium]|nr:DUF2799 domain-containing protein [Bacteriovoracales bacterium]
MKLIILCITFCFATGCAHTLSKRECSKNKLFEIGKKMAYKGTKFSIFKSLRKSCKKYGVDIKELTFQKGWFEGMKGFCTTHRGFHWGITGKDNPNICTEEFKDDFERGYARGKSLGRNRG